MPTTAGSPTRGFTRKKSRQAEGGEGIAPNKRRSAVLLISEDLDEILDLSDRVLVMTAGRIGYETDRTHADRYVIGRHMAQGTARLSA